MRARRRTGESGHTTCYRQWNHTRARSTEKKDKEQRNANHIALPSRQVSSLISNDVFNINATAYGAIRLNSRYLLKRPGHLPTRNLQKHDA